MQAEIVAAKTQIAENAKQGVKMQLNVQNQSSLTQKLTNALPFLKTKAFLWSVRAVVGIVGVVFVIVGINGGGMDDVLEKAINICTQCIGLG